MIHVSFARSVRPIPSPDPFARSFEAVAWLSWATEEMMWSHMVRPESRISAKIWSVEELETLQITSWNEVIKLENNLQTLCLGLKWDRTTDMIIMLTTPSCSVLLKRLSIQQGWWGFHFHGARVTELSHYQSVCSMFVRSFVCLFVCVCVCMCVCVCVCVCFNV